MAKIGAEDLKIEYIDVNKLIPNEYNPKTMNQKQHDDLVDSLEDFGMVEPVVVNCAPDRKNIIIGGHQRWEIHKELGKKKIPVVYVDIPDLENEQEICMRLSHNTGEWDWDLLANFDENILKNVIQCCKIISF